MEQTVSSVGFNYLAKPNTLARLRNLFFRETQDYLAVLPGRLGVLVRRSFYTLWGAKFGNGLKAERGVIFVDLSRLELGHNVAIGRNGFLSAHGGTLKIGNNVCINFNSCLDASPHGEIIVGNDVLIAQNVVVRACSHEFTDHTKLIRHQGHRTGRVVIEDNVWIGANVVIAGHVRIGTGSVIGAGAVVTSDVAPFSVCVSRWRKPEVVASDRLDAGL